MKIDPQAKLTLAALILFAAGFVHSASQALSHLSDQPSVSVEVADETGYLRARLFSLGEYEFFLALRADADDIYFTISASQNGNTCRKTVSG